MSERYRYVGPDASRMLALSGGGIEFPRMKWVDPEKAAEDAGIPVHHVAIAVAGLGDDFEREGPVKAARTRRKNAEADASDEPVEGDETAPEGPETPAVPDEEQS